MRSIGRQVALPSTASLLGRGGFVAGGGRTGGGATGESIRRPRISASSAAPPSRSRERKAAEKSSTVAIANRVALAGGELSWSMFLTIVGASGREGS